MRRGAWIVYFSVILPIISRSLGSPFGSYVLSMDGILLNNAMNDFSVPGEASQHGYPSSQVSLSGCWPGC